MSLLRSQVRIGESGRMLKSLRSEIDEWFARRNFGQQYQTQVRTLQDVLAQALYRLELALSSIQPGAGSADVYAACRSLDRRLVWVRRLWEFFQIRFDQRIDSRFTGLLAAADEVVWACYAGPMRRAAPFEPLRPSPLPYVEAEFIPRAFTRDDLPRGADAVQPEDRSADLKPLLSKLPIPVVGLPAGCVVAPWWLVYSAHEVGHQLAADLDVLPSFQAALEKAASGPAGAAADAVDGGSDTGAAWFNWGDEVFADLFSVCCLGSSAGWAMAELENRDECGMLTPLPRYPAPAVRLALMRQAVTSLSIADSAALGEVDPDALAAGPPLPGPRGEDLRASARAELERLPAIVQAGFGLKLPANKTMPQLCEWTQGLFDPYKGRLSAWQKHFSGSSMPLPQGDLQDTRLMMAAGVLAWRDVMAVADEARRHDLTAALGETMLAALVSNHEETTRSAEPLAQDDTAEIGNAVADWLLAPGLDETGL